MARQKENADFKIIEDRSVPQRGNILSDQIIELEGYYSKLSYPYQLRRVEVWNDRNKEVIVLLLPVQNLYFIRVGFVISDYSGQQ